ncbi:hypothetical protein [Paenibacillus planticolens]|uniref:hypothetical protein n=1 Tax=Paenibacillus planticolens TaxID=2654976 RepID=UPI00149195DA|nr:hypothetical protein [Paenibacillus planticolens]
MDKYLIIKELDSLNDNLSSLGKCVDLLYNIQKSQGPLVEVVTILKFEKPILYPYIKARFENNPVFKMLFEVTFEYEHAKNSLKNK